MTLKLKTAIGTGLVALLAGCTTPKYNHKSLGSKYWIQKYEGNIELDGEKVSVSYETVRDVKKDHFTSFLAEFPESSPYGLLKANDWSPVEDGVMDEIIQLSGHTKNVYKPGQPGFGKYMGILNAIHEKRDGFTKIN